MAQNTRFVQLFPDLPQNNIVGWVQTSDSLMLIRWSANIYPLNRQNKNGSVVNMQFPIPKQTLINPG